MWAAGPGLRVFFASLPLTETSAVPQSRKITARIGPMRRSSGLNNLIKSINSMFIATSMYRAGLRHHVFPLRVRVAHAQPRLSSPGVMPDGVKHIYVHTRRYI